MAYAERKILYENIAQERGNTVLAYVNNIRLLNAPMCVVSVRYIYKIIKSLSPDKLKDTLDFIMITNGGDTNAPLRIISLLRCFFKRINVILPYRCYSAGTALALGCDNIIMGPMSNLGPIDPSVNNPHNVDEKGKLLPAISVEAVKAYFTFVSKDLKIKSENHKAEALNKLITRISPIALGCVKQGTSHAKLIAKNLLCITKKFNFWQIRRIINMLSSDFHTHSYPITREEVVKRVKIDVINMEDLNTATFDFAGTIGKIHEDFSKELKWDEDWIPQHYMDEITTGAGFNFNQLPIDTDLIQTAIESSDDERYYKKETLRLLGQNTPQGPLYGLKTVKLGWSK